MMDAVAEVSLESGSIVGECVFFLLSMMGNDAPLLMS